METWTVTEARRQLPSLLDKANRGQWQLIGRRNRREAVLADADEIGALLGAAYRFHPEVVMSDHDVGLWLPELNTHATAATLDEALCELADVMLGYAEDWEDQLRHAVNHRDNIGYVRRIELAGDVDGVVDMLHLDAEAQDVQTA
jgi:prevent-host-death family protein